MNLLSVEVFMADNVTPFPQGVRHKNLKADAFEKYMKAEGLNFFRRQDVHDSLIR